MKFRIYRYNPDTDTALYMRDYELDIEAGDKMLLDAILSFLPPVPSRAKMK